MVRPVDLQDNLSKAPLAGRLQHLQQDGPEMAHRQAVRTLAQQQRADLSRPVPSGQSDGVALHPDHGRQESRRRVRRRRPGGQDAGAGAGSARPGPPAAAGDTSHIDVIA
ncbi:MAG: hypothetical protein AB1505_27835 [Candidatus Latescibacterota bacterium]